MTQMAVPHLLKNQGTIVNVSSNLSVRPCFIGQWYGVSKVGILQLFRKNFKAALDHYTRISAALYSGASLR